MIAWMMRLLRKMPKPDPPGPSAFERLHDREDQVDSLSVIASLDAELEVITRRKKGGKK